jgi:hypothetical protein
MRILLVIACLFACGAAQAEKYYCGPAKAKPPMSKPEVITLNREARKGPAFYARVDQLVMFFKPEDVLEAARANQKHFVDLKIPAYIAQQAAFIDAIAADLPLKEHADLFKYSFRDKFFGTSAQAVIDVLLEQGRASVGDWQHFGDKVNPDLDDAKIILRASQYSGGEEISRTYCTEYGAVLFGALYVVY